MKAAVMYPDSGIPIYTEVSAPEGELVSVRAVALKHVDKSRASGKHYSSEGPDSEGRVIGGDGIFELDNGSRVYALGDSGTMAERATIDRARMVPVPAGLDDAKAAALPNAVTGAAMGLRFKADIRPGDTVLVNGATGFTGRVAVQLAKQYGAGKVIATGRNPASLQELLTLGADEVVPITGSNGDFSGLAPFDIVIDYLWGHTAELILCTLKGRGRFGPFVRYVSVGSMAGDLMQLSAAQLRSVNLQLTGSGLGAWTREQVGLLFSEILPEAYQLTLEGKLKVKTVTMPMSEIAHVWDLAVPDGGRLVVTM